MKNEKKLKHRCFYGTRTKKHAEDVKPLGDGLSRDYFALQGAFDDG